LKGAVDDLPPSRRLAAIWALSRLGQREFAVEKTLALLSSKPSAPVLGMAADLLGRIGDASCQKKLLPLLDETLDPLSKIALAKALWDTSRNMRAKRDLLNLLKSDEDEVKIPAAFALAEIGDIEPVKRILGRLKDEPTDRGRLAKVLLRQHALLKRLERWTAQSGERRKKFKSPLLEEIRLLVRTYYVDPLKGNFERLSGEGARGVAAALDSYCAYLSESEMIRTQDRLAGRLVGVGIVPGRRGYVPVVGSVIFESPAAQAGLRPLDQIWEIDGRNIVEEGLSLLEVQNRLHGLPNRAIKIKVFRAGWFRAKDITLRCSTASPPMLVKSSLPGGILFVRVNRIRAGLAKAFEKAWKEEDSPKALVLDFRNNPGGNLVDTVAFLELFLPKGTPLFRTEGRDPTLAPATSYTAQTPGTITVPMTVLVDRGTFGTAELVSAVLKAAGRARLVGEKTHGKGCFQQVIILEATGKKTGLQLTVGRYYVKDKIFDHQGVEPDQSVKVAEPPIWKPELVDEILAGRHDVRYMAEHIDSDIEIIRRLAHFDGRDWNQYPGFAAWYDSLKTHLDREDVRKLLRRSLRKAVGLKDGHPLVADLVEDIVLLAALPGLAKAAGIDLKAYPKYRFAQEDDD
jgi:carboxyl-terminal processing protease